MAENLVEEFKAYRKKMSMLEQVVALFQWDMETLTPKNGLQNILRWLRRRSMGQC